MTKLEIFFIAAALCFLILFIGEVRKRHAGNAGYESIIAEKTDSIRYRKSETGREIASKEAAFVSARQLGESYAYHLAEVRKELGIKEKQVKALLKITSTAHGSGTTIIRDTVFIDSTGTEIPERTFALSDGYLSMAGRFHDKSDLFYQYSYTDSVSIVTHTKKQGLFGPTKLFVSASFANPNNHITGLTNVLVSEARDKRFGVGPFVGYGFSNGGAGVQIGVSVQYSLIRF